MKDLEVKMRVPRIHYLGWREYTGTMIVPTRSDCENVDRFVDSKHLAIRLVGKLIKDLMDSGF